MKPITPQELSPNMSYVRYNGMILKVASVEHPQPLKEKRFSDKWIITLFCDGFITCTIDEIEPIELTEEILFRLGFEKSSDYWIKTNSNFFFGFSIDLGLMYLFNDEMITPHRIKHLHELQNTYYALTGKELELKPKKQ